MQQFDSQIQIIRNSKNYQESQLHESVMEAFDFLGTNGLQDKLTSYGITPIQTLIEATIEYPSVMKFFAQTAIKICNCNVNQTNNQGDTALHTLFRAFSKEVEQRNSWVHESERDTIPSLLSFHVSNDILPAAAVLVAAGADLNAKNNQGQTPFDIFANMRRSLSIVELTELSKVDYSINGLVEHYKKVYNEAMKTTVQGGSALYSSDIPKPIRDTRSFEFFAKIDEQQIAKAANAENIGSSRAETVGGHASRVQANRAQAADAAKKGCCTIL